MKKTHLFVMAALVSMPAFANSGQEPSHATDHSREYQVTARPLGSVASYILSESFDAGIPATWTVVDNAGSGLVWSNQAGCGGRANVTGGTGNYACASSDAAFHGGNTELRTPLLNLSAAAAPAALTFNLNFQDFAGADTFALDVSIAGASGPWINLLTRNTDSPEAGEAINLDIASLVGEANVMFRFTYTAPGWNWFVQVDDVVLLNDRIFGNDFEEVP